jgi:hypothetical protein
MEMHHPAGMTFLLYNSLPKSRGTAKSLVSRREEYSPDLCLEGKKSPVSICASERIWTGDTTKKKKEYYLELQINICPCKTRSH